MLKRAVLSGLGLLVVLLVGGCDDEDDGYERPTGRGSVACQAWQTAFCDHVALSCGDITEQECVDDYYGVNCLSDAAAESCATALEGATCGTVPSGCNLSDIADPDPAIDACNTYIATVCQRTSECGGGTIEACTAEAATELDCSQAMAYGLTFEQCISEMDAISCAATELPDSCREVIKLSQ